MRPANHRPGRALWWALAAVFVLAAGFAAGRWWWLQRGRYGRDATLLAELAEVTFDDDPPPAADWPQWRGAHRDGITSGRALDKWPEAGPKRLWTADAGDGFSSFAVTADAVYSMIIADADKDTEAVVCWGLADGKERWRHTYDAGGVFQYGGPRATPTVAAGRLYTVSPAGRLMCLGADKGNVIWERDLPRDLGGKPPRWGYASSPLVEGGLVYVVPGGEKGRSLAAVRAETGEVAWSSQDGSAGYSSPVAATIGGRRQVIFQTGTQLVGVTPEAGERLWSYEWKDQFEVNAATPLVIQGRNKAGERVAYVFISSGYERGCALVKVEGREGAFQARAVYTSKELRVHFASPVRYNDHIYAFDEKEDLTCWDLRAGKVAWRFDRGGEDASSIRRRAYGKGSLLRVNDALVVYGDTAKLARVACDPAGYRELDAFLASRSAEKTWAMPAVAGGRLVVRDRKKVACFDIASPRE